MPDTRPPTTRPTLLKLGGSLITDKTRPGIARLDVLARLAQEIAAALSDDPRLYLVLGHGSGSFGHVPASRHGTRQGVSSTAQWRGFVEVWRQASDLNRLVIAALHAAGLQAVTFPPSAAVTARRGQVLAWDLAPLQAALAAGLLPVVYGDVVFDTARGGGILSTEDLFAHLARHLLPRRMLLAGLQPGVWADYPACTRLVPEITPSGLEALASGIGAADGADVTGGMAGKVEQALSIAEEVPGLEVRIFSAESPGSLQRALGGEALGTLLRPDSTQN